MTEIKDKRSANFTQSEVDLLVDIVTKYKSIIENKKTDATTWKEKNDTWVVLADEFNASSGNFARSAKSLKAEYDSIKKNLRKKCASVRREHTKTGGGISECSELNSFEEKILGMTQYSMMGLTSRFDNDNTGSLPTHNEYEEIEYIEDNGVIEFLKSQGEIPNNDKAREIPAELPTQDIVDVAGPSRPREDETMRANISTADNSSNNSKTAKTKTQGVTQTKGSKFIHKQKRRKVVHSENSSEIIEMKRQVLQLQKEYIEFEKENKKQIHELIIENLKMDLKIKKAKLRRLNEGLDDENGDSQSIHTDYCQYIDGE